MVEKWQRVSKNVTQFENLLKIRQKNSPATQIPAVDEGDRFLEVTRGASTRAGRRACGKVGREGREKRGEVRSKVRGCRFGSIEGAAFLVAQTQVFVGQSGAEHRQWVRFGRVSWQNVGRVFEQEMQICAVAQAAIAGQRKNVVSE